MGSRRFLTALGFGVLVAGPAISYAGGTVRFGFGFTSSYDLTMYAALTLGIGSVTGLIAAVAAWKTACHPLRTAIATTCVAGALWGLDFAADTGGQPLLLLKIWLTLAAGSALTGVATAKLTQWWLETHRDEDAHPPAGAGHRPQERYRL